MLSSILHYLVCEVQYASVFSWNGNVYQLNSNINRCWILQEVLDAAITI